MGVKPFFTKEEYLPDVVLDLDDLAENPGNSQEALELLIKQKEKFPRFKVTLFAIPFYQDKDNSPFYKKVINKYGDWIQLAIHGWKHDTSMEWSKIDYKTARKYLEDSLAMGCFVKGFKAPGWQMSRDAYKAVYNHGLWIADHVVSQYTEKDIPNEERRPEDMRVYSVDHPWIVHGHTWDVTNPDPRYQNGIRQMIEDHGVVWDEKSKFHFISEVV